MPETRMKVIKDTVTISGLDYGGQNQVQLKDVDPIELQLFIGFLFSFMVSVVS